MTADLIAHFRNFYSDFCRSDLSLLTELYDPQVTFVDPVHAITGLPELRTYFENSRTNISYCRFEFESQAVDHDRAFFQWQMHYAHPRISANSPQVLRGCSALKIDGKIIYHEDYYDLGAMLYDHLPLLGWATRTIKRNLAKG